MKKIIFTFFILNCFLSFSQNSKVLPDGIYETYEDFINKRVTKYTKPFKIKRPAGTYYYNLKDSTKNKLKQPYFAIVQNDSILVRIKDIAEIFESNKNVIIHSRRKFDYNLALYNSNTEIYFEQLVSSKSIKFIGLGIGYYKGVVFNLETAKSYIFMEYNDLKSYLTSIDKLNLLKHLTKKRRIDAIEVANLIKKHFETE